MRTGEDIEIISMAKMIREEEHEKDAILVQKQKQKKKAEEGKDDDGSEQIILDMQTE